MTFMGDRHAKAEMCNVTVDGRVLRLPELLPGEQRHSPTGFEWGYWGSGPAELARAILIEVFPGDPAVRHPRIYQEFKTAVIGKIRTDLWTFEDGFVRQWFAEWSIDHPRELQTVNDCLRLEKMIGDRKEV